MFTEFRLVSVSVAVMGGIITALPATAQDRLASDSHKRVHSPTANTVAPKNGQPKEVAALSAIVVATHAADAPVRSATRMDLTAREIPQSVSIITRQRLDDLGATNLDDALSLATGITVGQYDSQRTNFFARGFSINNFQIDGLPRGPNAPLQDTALWQRIEVVRGATGLMGSTGDPSASINMIRKRPTKTFQGSAAITAGSWNDRRVDADVSTPLTRDGRIRARVVAAKEDRDSYLDRYHEDKRVGMGIIEADLTENTLLTLEADHQDNKPKAATWGALPYWTSSGDLANFQRHTNFAPNWSAWNNKQTTSFASLDHRFANGWTVHAGYGHTVSDNTIKVAYVSSSGYPNPADGSGLSISTGLYGPSKYVNDNYDLYATGPFQWFGRTHNLILGWNGGNQTYTSLKGTSSIPYSPIIADYRTYTADIPEPSFVLNGARSVGNTRLTGAYAAVQWQLADTLHLITGMRVSDYRTDTANYNPSGVYTNTTGSLRNSNELTPYAGVTWDLTRQWSAYASYTSVFKPQTYRDRNEQYLAPVTGSAAEIGIKAEALDGALAGSVAVFQMKQTGIAEPDAGITLSDGSQAYRATGSGITARGFETEVSGAVSDRWDVTAGYTFLNARDGAGDRAVPTQPRHLLQLSTFYRFGGWLQDLRAGVWVRAQSSTYAVSTKGQPPTFSKTPAARIPQSGYAITGLMASYPITQHVIAQVNVSNLFDKHYYRSMGFYDAVLWGEPRNVKLSLRATF